eukprot:TRINITY_DN9573_c0_g1_i1.p1 TRINITY_DN9573_c0_g1~~TRINITY_DN9573_c0_g1_i1.p1  ORF type:complete len:1124 (-),score=313.22 TRINITY_DN9573_c0_g1_i1:86-3457(-)
MTSQLEAEEQSNFIRLHELLSQCTIQSRELFKKRWLVLFKEDWREGSEELQWNGIKSLMGDSLNGMRNEQKRVLEKGETFNWDLPLLSSLLSSQGFQNVKGDLVPKMNLGLDSHFKSAQKIRNNIAHLPHSKISTEDYERLWPSLEESALELGVSKAIIDKIRRKEIAFSPDVKEIEQNLEKAESFIKRNKWTDAIKCVTQGLTMNAGVEERAKLHALKSIALCGQGAFKKGKVDAKLSISLHPDSTTALIGLGKSYYGLKKYKKSVEAFEDALVLDHSNVEAKKLYSEALEMQLRGDRFENLDIDHTKTDTTEFTKAELAKRGLQGANFSAMMNNAIKNAGTESDFIEGEMYLFGMDKSKGYSQNIDKAVQCFSKAAAKGSASGMYRLGQLYTDGKGVQKDLSLAFQWFKKASEIPFKKENKDVEREKIWGIAQACSALGLWYNEGIHVKRDPVKAVQYFKIAVDGGSDAGYVNLGCSYWNGDGIDKNPQKAYNLFNVVASKGNSRAMFNIGEMYASGDLGKVDMEKAKNWWRKAANSGFAPAQLRLGEKTNNTTHKLSTPISSLIPDVSSHVTGNPKTSEKTSKHKYSEVSQEEIELFIKELHELDNNGINPMPARKDVYEVPKLQEWAANGSKTAQIMLESRLSWVKGVQLLKSGKKDPKHSKEVIRYLANSFLLTEIVIPLTADVQAEAHALCEAYLKQNPNDLLAMILFAGLQITQSPYWVIKYLVQCQKKHPTCGWFYFTRAGLNAAMGNPREALQDLNKGLSVQPEAWDQYCSRGTLLRTVKEKQKQSIEDMKIFLAHTPEDDRRVPEAYFSMAFTLFSEDEEESLRLYYLGLEAEKKLLPCFDMSQSQTKKFLMTTMKYRKPKEKPVEIKPIPLPITDTVHTQSPKEEEDTRQRDKEIDSVSLSAGNKEKLDDMYRQEIITKHRNFFKQHMAKASPYQSGHTLGHPPPKIPVQISGLKEIMLEEMEFGSEKTYKGRVLNGFLLEWPIYMNAAHSVIEDDNGRVERVSFYNICSDASEAFSKLAPGTRVSIVNPYVKLAISDGNPVIRVDDPKSVFIQGGRTIMCGCCGAVPSKLMLCSKCKGTRYCSTVCQKKDWSTYSHKSVCYPSFYPKKASS